MAEAKYLMSANVRVFPTAFRKSVSVTSGDTTTQTTYNPESKLNTEFNLTTMAARLADRSTFVLEYAKDSDIMTVSIHGYWFELTKIAANRTEGNQLWAAIRIYDPNVAANDNSRFSLPTLCSLKDGTPALDSMNLDGDTGYFFGLGLYDSKPVLADGNSGTLYSLQLFDEGGNVPEGSYLKISTDSVSDGRNSDKSISDEFTTKKAAITTNFDYSGIQPAPAAIAWKSLWFSDTNTVGPSLGTPFYSDNLQYYPCTGILRSVCSGSTYTKTARLCPDKLTFRTAYNDTSSYKYESALTASTKQISMYWKTADDIDETDPLFSVDVDSDRGDVKSSIRSNTLDGSSITLETSGTMNEHSKLIIGHRRIEGYAAYSSTATASPTFGSPIFSISCDATASGSSSTVTASSICATSTFNYSGIGDVPTNTSASFKLWASNSANSKGIPQLLSSVYWNPLASNLSVGGSISTTGVVTVGQTCEAKSFNASSDRRLKENIVDYSCEKSILDLPIKRFDFIDGPKNQIGCIAQDLREICPEIAHEGEDGYLSIQESKIVYLLLQEVKKLRAEVDELKGSQK